MKDRPIQKRVEEVEEIVPEHREASGLSQEAFADEIRMHRAYYGALERGEKSLQLSTLESVYVGVGVSMWEIIKDADS